MILITGLDGSGKSTLLKKLEEGLGNKVSVLRLPAIDAEKFKSNDALYKCCEMVNFLNEKADKENNPSLKVIAMFSSVILFKELYNHLSGKGARSIFCERHPLIDTAVYAKAYSKVLNPELLDLKVAKEIGQVYRMELMYVVKQMNISIIRSDKGVCFDLLHFLYSWFSIPQNFEINRLLHIFSISKPEMVYFLDAPEDTLLERLDLREIKEYHENKAGLSKMRRFYLDFLPNMHLPYEIIDASSIEKPNALLEFLLGKCS